MRQTVLILGGSGKIGSRATDAFWNAGWEVRQYDRTSGDMVAAARGVDVIVNGLNPPAYHDWERTIPEITSQVIAAAQASGATVIIPGNVYNYGDQPGVLGETTPQNALTKKGRVRIEMEESYRAAGVPTIVLRAGNFIDPAGNGDIMSMLVMRNIAKGTLTSASDPGTLQAYAYVPDWARAAVQLAEKRSVLAPFEDVPFPGHAFTINTLQAAVQAKMGRQIKISRFPWAIMTVLAPFWELAREMREMRYLYEMPHQISAAKFKRLLPGFIATPLDEVMLAGLPADIHPNKVVNPSRQPIVT
ncbi:NAD-dependent epimerase/dehydratase family protein [Loktanella sp. Alg231-35]|uniref:NAD-dependent epimerase/dehydratase family protein n=1 Tax=Loktanella sp. Alg231-35 TaxID=1922220 RepID=UPI000D54F9E5|nr:NAD-dependent epimerase/dehydratase family protein [Loktanella sp. Alg231-35]